MGNATLLMMVRRTSWRGLAVAGITCAGPLGCGATVGSEQPAAQGGSAHDGATPIVPSDGGSGGAVEKGVAGSAGSNGGVRRAPGSDSSNSPTTEVNESAEPELITQTITRDSTYYYVTYCNDGTGSSGSTFTIKLTNTATDESFVSNPLYPFSVPAPGTCATTGGFTCGLIGDPTCSQCVSVQASVDSDDTVAESDESNNDLTAAFDCAPTEDLFPRAITRDSTYYYVTYCNSGAASSGSTFTVKLTNTATDESFVSNPLYPFSVPAPGTCATTGGLTCGLIGDPSCSLAIAVSGAVDPDNTVAESDELNNQMIVAF